MKRSVLTATACLTAQAQQGGFRSKWAMLTLTYRNAADVSQKHVSGLHNHIRNWLSRRGHEYRFVWVGEMQKRGVLHYHILVLLPRGLTLPKPDKQGWWPHGSTRIEWARCAGGYLAKYTSKGDNIVFPKGTRIHGCGGLRGEQRSIWRWWMRPRYVREAERNPFVQLRRVPGGWLNMDTGELLISPWRFVGWRNGFAVMRLKESPVISPDGSR